MERRQPSHIKFTPEEVATIKSMVERGFLISAIVTKLGRTYASVMKKCYVLGICSSRQPLPRLGLDAEIEKVRRSRWTTAEEELLLRLHADGLHTRAIASELGRSLRAVQHRCKRLLLNPKKVFHPVATNSTCDFAQPLKIGRYRRWTKQDDETSV